MKKVVLGKELVIGLASILLASCGGGGGGGSGSVGVTPSGGGTSSGGGTGQTTPTCPTGQTWNGTQCVCPSNDMLVNNQCIPINTSTAYIPIYEEQGYFNAPVTSITLNGNVINNVALDTGQGGGLVVAGTSISNGNYGVNTGQSCSGQYGGGQYFNGQIYSATVCVGGLCTTMNYCVQTNGDAFSSTSGYAGDLGIGCSTAGYSAGTPCFPALLGYNHYSFSFISLTNNAENVSSSTPIGYLILGGSVNGNYTTISYNGYNATMYSPSAISSSVSYSAMFDTGTWGYLSFGPLLQQLPNWSSSSSQYLDNCYVKSGYTLYFSNTNSNLYLFSLTTYDPNQSGYGNLINNLVCYAGAPSAGLINFEIFGLPFFFTHQVEYDLDQNGITYQLKVSN